jgi:hypothetical protein
VERQYVYDDDSYDALAKAEIGWREADAALHGSGPQIVRHIGSAGLTVVARASGSDWLVMGVRRARRRDMAADRCTPLVRP